jgi:hypothetical protein
MLYFFYQGKGKQRNPPLDKMPKLWYHICILRRIKEMAKNSWGNYTQSDVVQVGDAQVFVSYYTPIAIAKDDYILVLDRKISRTTTHQTNRWLRHMGNDAIGRNYNYNIVYVNVERLKEVLESIGYTGGMGMLRSFASYGSGNLQVI